MHMYSYMYADKLLKAQAVFNLALASILMISNKLLHIQFMKK